jgi:hypothetical protein
MMFGRN